MTTETLACTSPSSLDLPGVETHPCVHKPQFAWTVVNQKLSQISPCSSLACNTIHPVLLRSEKLEIVRPAPTVAIDAIDGEAERLHELTKLPDAVRFLVGSPIGFVRAEEVSLRDATSPERSKWIEPGKSSQDKVWNLNSQLPPVLEP